MRTACSHALCRAFLPVVVLAAALAMPVKADITVSAAVGVPLQAAKAALAAKNYDLALSEIAKATAAPGITAQEKWAVELTRAAIFKAQAQFGKAAIAFEAALTLVPMSPEDQGGALETLSQLWYRDGDFRKSAEYGEKAMAAGRRSDAFRQMVAEAYYRAKEPAKAAKLVTGMIDEQRKAGRTPSVELLQLQAASEFGSGNNAGYIKALRQQLMVENSRIDWFRLFDAMERDKRIPERLDLDWARLRFAADAYDNPESYSEMAQRAMVEELPAEAATVLDKGWKAGILGKGPKLDRQQRLRDYANQQLAAQKPELDARQAQALAAKDANAIAKLAMIRASFGDVEQGIALLQQALKGKLMSPTLVRLRLGMLQYKSGQTQAAAQTMATLPPGSDEARLGELWGVIYKVRK